LAGKSFVLLSNYFGFSFWGLTDFPPLAASAGAAEVDVFGHGTEVMGG
jgi:hypothetical protein